MTRVARFIIRFLSTLDAENPDLISRCSIVWETTDRIPVSYTALRVRISTSDIN
jgi:hypothetical protein